MTKLIKIVLNTVIHSIQENTVLNVLFFRILRRLGDLLVGVHDLLLGGNDLDVPGGAGLSDAVQESVQIVQNCDIFHY